MALTARKKRFVIAMPLGILTGFACVAGLGHFAEMSFWGTAIMWLVLADRFVLGVMVGLVGAFTRHPILNFPLPACFRGCCMGVFSALPLSAGLALAPEVPSQFVWIVIIAGAVLGSIIDVLATKFGGEGKAIAE